MRIRGLGRILQPALIAVAAILIIAPGISPACDETPSGPYSDAVPGIPHRGAVPGHPGSPRGVRGYSSVLIGSLLVGFTERFLANRERREHRVRGADLERMERTYREVFGSKLAKAYAISEVPGPCVLRADALLIDHVLDKRDWLSPLQTSFRSAPPNSIGRVPAGFAVQQGRRRRRPDTDSPQQSAHEGQPRLLLELYAARLRSNRDASGLGTRRRSARVLAWRVIGGRSPPAHTSSLRLAAAASENPSV